ncbi:MauE/DoxX family redox-associated membrane protein [Marinomonas epiphytica]
MSTVAVSREKLAWSLLGLRLGVFVVFFMWTLDKFINPEHAAVVMKVFYSVPELSNSLAYLLGAVQLALIVSFLVGFQKRWATLIILAMHLSSTLVSFGRYLDPWGGSNLLFFAAWPMLAATLALYLLREYDTKWSLGKAE